MRAKLKKIQNIVVTLDFSKSSANALARAVQIAKIYNAKLTLLHVVQKSVMDSVLESFIPKKILILPFENAQIFLSRKVARLQKQGLKVDFAIISKGDPKLKIIQYTKKNKTDLLIMGAHGKYSVRDTFVGTTAEYVISHSICPVLVVKNDNLKPYKKIFLPIDFSTASKRAVKYAVEIFSTAKISILHVTDYEYELLFKREENQYAVSAHKIKKLKASLETFLNKQIKMITKMNNRILKKKLIGIKYGYPGPTILNEIQKRPVDLVVMGTQGHGRSYYLFLGSVAKRVLSEISEDILFVPPKK